MRIKPSDRVSFFGTTGSGKSAAARHLLRLAADAANREKHPDYTIYILHTKPERKFPFASRFFPGSSYEHVKSLANILGRRKRICVVEPTWHERGKEGFHWFFEQLYYRAIKQRKPFSCYTDEGNAITEGRANSGSLFFKLLYTEGRGLDAGMFLSYQDPAFIQREALTQATHVFGFWCRSPRDRKVLSEAMDYPIPRVYPDEHGFVYAGGRDPALYYPDLQTATGVPLIF